MFQIFLMLLFSFSTIYSENLFECRNGTFRSIRSGDNGLRIRCGGGEKYESFIVAVRDSDFKKVKVNVQDSYTGQRKQLVLPIQDIKDHLDIYGTGDGYVTVKFSTHALADSHNLKGSVKFESYLLSPDIYVSKGNKRFKLADLFNEHKKSVMKCNYSQTPDLIKINREIYCSGRGSCTIDGRNVPNMPFLCMAKKGSKCPDATVCAVEDKERKYTRNNW